MFPLLSDEGSRVIRELGVFDDDLARHQQAFGVSTRPEQWGVAYPITFVLDTEGRVVEKRTEENYRLRESGPRLVRHLVGRSTATEKAGAPGSATTGAAAEVADDVISARIALDGKTYFPYQRRDLQLDVRLAEGWHVYGPSAPEGSTAIGVALASRPAGVQVEPIRWPATTSLVMAGGAAPVGVYTGTARVVVPVTFVLERGSGDVVLEVTLESQACDATQCRPPARLRAELRITEAPIP